MYFNNPDNLTNPFQAGIPAIPGSSLGLQTNLGSGIYYLNPSYKLPYSGAAYFSQQYTDAVRDPGTQQIDVNLSKTFKLTEHVSMELRLEEFNVMNHPTWFWGVDSYPLDSSFGTVTKALEGQSNNHRLGQLGVKIIW